MTTQYGGEVDLGLTGTGYFRVQKTGGRWWVIDPEGKGFFGLALYSMGIGDGGTVAAARFIELYASNQQAFALHTAKRVKSWKFNGIAPFANNYIFPIDTSGSKNACPEKMPLIRVLNCAWYGAIHEGTGPSAKWLWAPQPHKTLVSGAIDPAFYTDPWQVVTATVGWPGHLPDPYDPNFKIFYENAAVEIKTTARTPTFTGWNPVTNKPITTGLTWTVGQPHPVLGTNPWLLGTCPDDADYIFGLPTGPDVPTVDGAYHPHIGWIIAITKPTQANNIAVGKAFGTTQTVTYADPIVYAKRRWRDMLAAKYGTIAALNAAWGSNYTTFDSAGGWGSGSGLLDENGRHAWIGRDWKNLSTTPAAVRVDMDAMLLDFARKYFSVTRAAIKLACPNHMFFSCIPLNGHKGLSRSQVLQAAGELCDIVEINSDPERPELLDYTIDGYQGKAGTGDVPLWTWMGVKANPDSSQYLNPDARSFPTQEARAASYRDTLHTFATHRPNGVGISFWEFIDKVGEKSNWGVVTPRLCAYDGIQARVAANVDPYGYTMGGEAHDYGDFLTGVKQAHTDLIGWLTSGGPDVTPPSAPGFKVVSITR